MEKFKTILVQILDFINGIIVFFCALYGIALFVKDLFGFANIEAICIIIAFLMFGRFAIKISNKE